MIRHPLFSPYADFLDHTLNSKTQHEPRLAETATTRFVLHGEGILECRPHNPEDEGLVLSAGVHGNETAPIELLNQLVTDLLMEEQFVRRPLLILFGHPQAMREQKRFIDVNMNRLFCGAHADPAVMQSRDARRAAILEQHLAAFHERATLVEHYDLHTAIRESEVERFALYPFREHSIPKASQLDFLSAAGVSALVLQHRFSTTFSAHSAQTFKAESYTVELGQVKPFGENDLDQYHNVMQALQAIVGNTELTPSQQALTQYEVCHEIIHGGDGFRLHIPEQEKNFTAYPKGRLMWEQTDDHYTVVHDQEYIIFPNAKVPEGQRAGLMLKRA